MREIKFRAWDKNDRTMLELDCIEWDIYNNGASDNQVTGYNNKKEWTIIPLQDSILMQYTGFKDVNGREIYEGDILEVTEKDGCTLIVNVYFKNGQFLVSKYVYNLLYERNLDSIVIGNIYENPELLEEENEL